jgi:hypothetical protein
VFHILVLSFNVFDLGTDVVTRFHKVLCFDVAQTERSFICSDTGALLQEPPKRYQSYKKYVTFLYRNIIYKQHK